MKVKPAEQPARTRTASDVNGRIPRRVVQQPVQEVDDVLSPRLGGGDVNEGGDSPALLRRRVLPGLPGSSFIYPLTAF
jgi:hypothetical protein